MGSTLVLISLMLSLSIAVIFPEMKYSQTNSGSVTAEFDFMVNKKKFIWDERENNNYFKNSYDQKINEVSILFYWMVSILPVPSSR